MILLTPPSTSHRDKENRPLSHVTFSPYNLYHHLTKDSPPKLPAASGPIKTVPSKSILKVATHIPTPCEDQITRENTPEPSDPLANLTYLVHPVSKIVSPDSSLKDLIEGYCVLTARLRNTVAENIDADASWPLFQPLRKHNEAIVEAIIRDLGKALVDPLHGDVLPKEPLAEIDVILPSPKPSPQKKKQGMTEEQVKHARDLCTTCHSVVRLLTTMFTLPAIYKVFSDEQLRTILNRVLDIPLTAELPTPNSRKTNGLAIAFLHTQRLPSTVLEPIAPRFELAIQRAILGQLGKEGKRGAITDGLKAIEELASHQPDTFAPFFHKIMPGLLACISARSPQIRIQACQALRGMVIGSSRLPYDEPRRRTSITVATILTKSNQSKKGTDGNVVQTLRVSLTVADPTLASQGPVWALCVLANLIFLMGPFLCLNADVQNVVLSLLSLAMQHRKSSVRALAYLVWRWMTWVYVQPTEDYHKDTEEERRREEFWKILVSVVDMGAGIATVVTVLDQDRNPDTIRKVFVLIKNMIDKAGQTCGDAMDMLHHMVTSRQPPNFDHWDLLVQPVLKAMPNLLNVSYGALVSAVRPLFEKCPQVEHVRSLTAEELRTEWIFDEVIEVWILGLANLELHEANEIPNDVVDIWIGLMISNVKSLQDADDEQGLDKLAQRAVRTIKQMLQDPSLDFAGSSSEIPTSPIKGQQSSSSHRQAAPTRQYSNAALKLSFVHALWNDIRCCPDLRRLQNDVSRKLLEVLVQDEATFIGGADPQEDARECWARLCADLLVVCDVASMRWFWEYKSDDHGQRVRDWTPSQVGFIWRTFISQWLNTTDIPWEIALHLHIVPFTRASSYDLSDDDVSVWDQFLFHIMEQALGFDVDSTAVMDTLAQIASQEVCLGTCKSLKAADLFISHLELCMGRALPEAVLRFVDDALRSSYPPAQYNNHSLWLIRSLTNVIDACPLSLVDPLLEGIQEGLCIWISDKQMVLTEDEYSYNIVPLYQTAVVSLQALPLPIVRLEKLSPFLESAFCGREDKSSSLREAFIDFWQATYANETCSDRWPEKIQNCLRASFALSDAVVCDPSLPQEDAPSDLDPPLQETILDEKELFELEEVVGLMEAQEESGSESEVEEILPERSPLFEFARKQQAVDEASNQAPPADQPILVPPAAPSTPLPEKTPTFEMDDDTCQIVPFKLLSNLNPPSTPVRERRDRLWSSTPPRPRKPYAILDPSLRSPSTPLAASRRFTPPNRSPLSLIGKRSNVGSFDKRINHEDKENVSPQPRALIASTPERVLGKRPAIVDEEQHQHVSKKSKVDTDVPLGSAFANVTEISIQPLPTPGNAFITRGDTSNEVATDLPALCTSKKRKRVIMECVELPTLSQIRRQQRRVASFESLFTPPPSRSPRRTRSASKAQNHATIPELDHSARRRRRRGSLRESQTEVDPILIALRDPPALGSDDSITNYQGPPFEVRQLDQSSDDDPYDGQVAPHHLISPALRRVRKTDSDPPSDDSIISNNSPTRVVVARRLERLGQRSIDRIEPLA